MHVRPNDFPLYINPNLSVYLWRYDVDYKGEKATAGRFGVHLVREISPWYSQVLCIGLVKT